MQFNDFREFLDFLEDKGELKRVRRPVDRYLETALVTKKSIEEKGPALLFENVKGYGIPIASGVYGTQRRVCLGLDTTPEAFVRDYVKRSAKINDFSPRIVSSGPCKENIIKGRKVNLNKFPITWHAERDRGWYIDATCCIVKHPETRTRNASVHRLFIHEKNQTGLWMSPFNLWHIIMRYWEQGEACPMAVAIGVDPYCMMAASTSMPLEEDEFAFAGAQRGQAIDMVKCETVDLDVPATAEIILEGEIPPHERKLEAPFVEFTGYYGDERLAPIFNVKAITHRDRPIYHDIITGPPPDENQPMLITNIAEVHKVLARVFPEESILDVYLTEGGCTYFNCVVRIKKRYPGHGKQVASAVLSYQGVKNVIVVDDDIDARNHVQVEWAFATRYRGIKDTIVIPDTLGCPLDPTSIDGVVTKMGFDATKPVGMDKPMSQMVHNACYFPTDTVCLSDYMTVGRGKKSTVATKKKNSEPKKRYQCNRCGYILYAETGKTKKPPQFCPQCAVVHYKGEMAPVLG